MSSKKRMAAGFAILSLCAGTVRSIPHTSAGSDEPIPAFHTEAPHGALPATMAPETFTDVVVRNAYAVAARVKRMLYQQPCYCHCDRSQGHASLLDCYASKHASGCEICTREAFYTYEESRKGKTAAQIREGIERGDWQHVDMSKYEKPLPLR